MRGRGRGGSGYMLIGEEDLEGHIDGRRTCQSFIEFGLRGGSKRATSRRGRPPGEREKEEGTSRSVELAVSLSL
jgi:hypothetical protein